MQSDRASTLRRNFAITDVRSATGLIIGLYVTMHLSNHALGLISVEAQEAVRPWVMVLWHSPPGQVLLYGSLITHATMALLILFRRRHYYMPAWEGIQILLGLTIPYLLLVHIVNTRGTRILNCARTIGVGTFRRWSAFLVAALRLVSPRVSSFSSCLCADSHGSAARIRGSWDENDSARAK